MQNIHTSGVSGGWRSRSILVDILFVNHAFQLNIVTAASDTSSTHSLSSCVHGSKHVTCWRGYFKHTVQIRL